MIRYSVIVLSDTESLTHDASYVRESKSLGSLHSSSRQMPELESVMPSAIVSSRGVIGYRFDGGAAVKYGGRVVPQLNNVVDHRAGQLAAAAAGRRPACAGGLPPKSTRQP